MNEYSVGLSVVVFGRNSGEDLVSTLKTLKNLLEETKIPNELILVDDYSDVKPNFDSLDVDKFVQLHSNLGISGAILSGAEHAKYDKCLAVPSTNMYTPKAYLNIIENCLQYEIILGVRNNLRDTRPILKYLSSRLLLFTFRILNRNFSYINDLHGLNLFSTVQIIEHLPMNGRHGGQLQLLDHVLLNAEKKPFEVNAPISSSHVTRPSAKARDKRPSVRSIVDVLNGLYQTKKILSRPKNRDL